MEQSYFNYNLKPRLAIDDFFVSTSNKKAYNFILNKNIDNKKILLIGPSKSGKTHLGKIWQKNNDAISYENNFEIILNHKKNVFIDDFLNNINEEKIFHLINHCSMNKLTILLTSTKELFQYYFQKKLHHCFFAKFYQGVFYLIYLVLLIEFFYYQFFY